MMNLGMLLIGVIAIYGAYILFTKYKLVWNTESYLKMVLASLSAVLSYMLLAHCSGLALFAFFFLAITCTTISFAYNVAVALKFVRFYKYTTYYEFSL